MEVKKRLLPLPIAALIVGAAVPAQAASGSSGTYKASSTTTKGSSSDHKPAGTGVGHRVR